MSQNERMKIKGDTSVSSLLIQEAKFLIGYNKCLNLFWTLTPAHSS